MISPPAPLLSTGGVGEDAKCKPNSPFKSLCLCLNNVCENTWPFPRPPLPTPVLTAPWQRPEAPFSHHVPQELHRSNPKLEVQEVQREGDVDLIPQASSGCCAHHMRQPEMKLPLLPLDFRGPWSCCQSCLSCQHHIIAQPAEQGKMFTNHGGEFVLLCHLRPLPPPQLPHLPCTVKKIFTCF